MEFMKRTWKGKQKSKGFTGEKKNKSYLKKKRDIKNKTYRDDLYIELKLNTDRYNYYGKLFN